MRALTSESRGCKATSYVLVSSGDLQQVQAEWKDIALLRREGSIECIDAKAPICRRLALGFGSVILRLRNRSRLSLFYVGLASSLQP
jgi:hypothetical protein